MHSFFLSSFTGTQARRPMDSKRCRQSTDPQTEGTDPKAPQTPHWYDSGNETFLIFSECGHNKLINVSDDILGVNIYAEVDVMTHASWCSEARGLEGVVCLTIAD